jgi:nucleoside-diphosphate-sugar epimerase
MEVYGWQPISDEVEHTGTYKDSVAFDENTVPHPNAPYAVAKLGCEKYLEYAERAYGLRWTAMRQTNCYGRKDNDFFVTEQIISQMLKGDVCNLGYSEPYRNFIYIDDLLDAWETVINNPDKCAGEIFCIGPSNAIKIKDYVKIIASKIGWNGHVNWNTKPKRPGEIYLLNSNNNKITARLGWHPKVNINDGLDKTIAIWKNIVDNNVEFNVKKKFSAGK